MNGGIGGGEIPRRDVLKAVALAAGAALAGRPLIPSSPASAAESKGMGMSGAIPRRDYGSNGVQLSIIGFGGIVVMNVPQEQADLEVARAVEAGINYFDVAPSYGNAEERLGPALKPYRKDCFLACKTTRRDADRARQEMASSMERLRTDYFDLYQLHAITDPQKDVDAAFARGGVMDVLLEAKKDGRVRHLGFSAHSVEAALAAMDRYDFDSILFPVSYATYFEGDFGPTVLARAAEKGVSVLALKALARQKWPENAPERKRYPKCWYEPIADPQEQELALRFTLSQRVTSAIPPGEPELFWRAVQIAQEFRPITEEQTRTLRERADALNPIFRA